MNEQYQKRQRRREKGTTRTVERLHTALHDSLHKKGKGYRQQIAHDTREVLRTTRQELLHTTRHKQKPINSKRGITCSHYCSHRYAIKYIQPCSYRDIKVTVVSIKWPSAFGTEVPRVRYRSFGTVSSSCQGRVRTNRNRKFPASLLSSTCGDVSERDSLPA